MPEVPENLVPTDGLTNSTIRFDSMHAGDGGSAYFHFGMRDADGQLIGNYIVHVKAMDQSIDAMFVEAHRQMRDVLRQWLYSTEMLRQAYERKVDQTGLLEK